MSFVSAKKAKVCTLLPPLEISVRIAGTSNHFHLGRPSDSHSAKITGLPHFFWEGVEEEEEGEGAESPAGASCCN